ncbi:MAG: F0F1 ATP synthase subunit epsilon [Chloroflexi bacterium]|nr:F0F1 ATP synthase subunit epsilon [Chloroflexota bacterium]
MPLKVEVVSQDRLVWSGEADMVVLPGALGEMGILPDHAPLLTTLKPGFMHVKRGDQEEVFTIVGGFAEVQPDKVIVLADAAEHVDEIDEARAQAAKERAERLLAEGPADQEAYLAALAALRRANLRLEAVRRYRRRQRSAMPTPGSGADEHA